MHDVTTSSVGWRQTSVRSTDAAPNISRAARVMDVVDDGVTRGELRAGTSVKLVGDMIFGGIEHQAWAYLRGEGDVAVEDSAEGITDVVYRDLAPAPPAQQPDLAAATARLEKVAAALEKHPATLRKSKG